MNVTANGWDAKFSKMPFSGRDAGKSGSAGIGDEAQEEETASTNERGSEALKVEVREAAQTKTIAPTVHQTQERSAGEGEEQVDEASIQAELASAFARRPRVPRTPVRSPGMKLPEDLSRGQVSPDHWESEDMLDSDSSLVVPRHEDHASSFAGASTCVLDHLLDTASASTSEAAFGPTRGESIGSNSEGFPRSDSDRNISDEGGNYVTSEPSNECAASAPMNESIEPGKQSDQTPSFESGVGFGGGQSHTSKGGVSSAVEERSMQKGKDAEFSGEVASKSSPYPSVYETNGGAAIPGQNVDGKTAILSISASLERLQRQIGPWSARAGATEADEAVESQSEAAKASALTLSVSERSEIAGLLSEVQSAFEAHASATFVKHASLRREQKRMQRELEKLQKAAQDEDERGASKKNGESVSSEEDSSNYAAADLRATNSLVSRSRALGSSGGSTDAAPSGQRSRIPSGIAAAAQAPSEKEMLTALQNELVGSRRREKVLNVKLQTLRRRLSEAKKALRAEQTSTSDARKINTELRAKLKTQQSAFEGRMKRQHSALNELWRQKARRIVGQMLEREAASRDDRERHAVSRALAEAADKSTAKLDAQRRAFEGKQETLLGKMRIEAKKAAASLASSEVERTNLWKENHNLQEALKEARAALAVLKEEVRLSKLGSQAERIAAASEGVHENCDVPLDANDSNTQFFHQSEAESLRVEPDQSSSGFVDCGGSDGSDGSRSQSQSPELGQVRCSTLLLIFFFFPHLPST
jgi:hypothetical protein